MVNVKSVEAVVTHNVLVRRGNRMGKRIANYIKNQLQASRWHLLTVTEKTDLMDTKTKVINLEAKLIDPLIINIKLETGALMPTQPYETDACWDLYALDSMWLRPGEATEVPTGVYIDIPFGYEGELKIRSSLGKLGLELHHGAFDAGYQGETSPFVYNWTNARYEVSKGDRICQFMLRKKVEIMWNKVEEFIPTLRKTSGHGSSGK